MAEFFQNIALHEDGSASWLIGGLGLWALIRLWMFFTGKGKDTDEGRSYSRVRGLGRTALGFVFWTAFLALAGWSLAVPGFDAIAQAAAALSTQAWGPLLPAEADPALPALLTFAAIYAGLLLRDLAGGFSGVPNYISAIREGGSDRYWTLGITAFVVAFAALQFGFGSDPVSRFEDVVRFQTYLIAVFFLGLWFAPRALDGILVGGGLLLGAHWVLGPGLLAWIREDIASVGVVYALLPYLLFGGLALVALGIVRSTWKDVTADVDWETVSFTRLLRTLAAVVVLGATGIWLWNGGAREETAARERHKTDVAQSAIVWDIFVRNAEDKAYDKSMGWAFHAFSHLGVTLDEYDFRDFDLKGGNLTGNWLRGARFGGADLTDAVFEDARLTGADFLGARLEGTAFDDARLYGTRLGGVASESPDGECPVARGVSFYDARVRDTDFNCLKILYADFRHAWIAGSKFKGTEIRGADFRRAVLTDGRSFHRVPDELPDPDGIVQARITGSDFRGADLKYAGITQTHADENCIDGTTRLPETIQRPAECVETEDGQLRLGNGTLIPKPGR